MHVRREVNKNGSKYTQEDNAHRKNVEHQTVSLYGVNKARAYLHTDCIDKENETKFLHKMENAGLDSHSDMTEKDSYEKSASSPKAHAFHLDLAQHDADGSRQG